MIGQRSRMFAGARHAACCLPSLGLALPLVACAAATGDSVGSTQSALDPTDGAPSTTYLLTMSVSVHQALEPSATTPQSMPIPAPLGTCWQANTDGACNMDGEDVCGDYTCWTTDTGYQFWGELAAQVMTAQGQPIGNGAVSCSCALNTPQGLGESTFSTFFGGPDPNTATLNACSGNSMQNGGSCVFSPGQPLTLTVPVSNPTDQVALFAILDNIEQTPPAQVAGSPAQSVLQQLQTDVSTGGNAVSGEAKVIAAGARSSPWRRRIRSSSSSTPPAAGPRRATASITAKRTSRCTSTSRAPGATASPWRRAPATSRS